MHDIGTITVGEEKYDVVDVVKVGKCVLHILDRPIDQGDADKYIGREVDCQIDIPRR